MKDEEARELLGMLKAATTQYPLDDETVGFWLDSLKPLDAELATKAILRGIKSWTKFPTWAEYHELYAAHRRNIEVEARHQQIVTEGKLHQATPEWVWVWSWARFNREPRESRSFPQQADFGDPYNLMTKDEYGALREEWLAAGAPKRNPVTGAMERITGGVA